MAIDGQSGAAAREEPRPGWMGPLRVLLAAVMTLLLVTTSAVLIGLDYSRGRAAAVAQAEHRMRVFSDRLVDRYRILFGDTAGLVRIASVSDVFRRPPPDRLAAKVDLLREAVSDSPHVDGAYAGYPDGAFIHVVRLTGNDAWRRMLDAPANAASAVRTISPGPDGQRLSAWRFADADGRELGASTPVPAQYDPRRRPWYKGAAGRREVTVTRPYVMATTGELGVTVAQAHQDDGGVVVGVDVLLETVSRFLAAERISPGGGAFVLDEKGRMLIHSDPVVMQRILGMPPDASVGISDPVLRALNGAERIDDAIRIIEVDGRRHLARTSGLDGHPLLEGRRIVVTAPFDELTADADRALRHGLAISLAVLAAGALCAILFARWITTALQMLTLEAQRLRDLDFASPPEVRSHVKEISALAAAMDTARGAIRSFALYVPRELVRRIVQTHQFTGRFAQRQEVTALFTDIYDFTTISEHHAPEEVVSMLSGYFDVFSEGVAGHGGAIIQFLGDSVFAMWNAPIPDERHAENACRCALALQVELEAYNSAQRERGLPEFRTRFGIHSGLAVVGSVGARERLQYTGMGDTVNVASRLEGMNKQYGTTILVSRAVVARCPPDLRFRALGEAHAKGRDEALEVFELTGVTSEPVSGVSTPSVNPSGPAAGHAAAAERFR
jgi:adenylate cyclase